MKILIDARLYGLENAGLGRYVMNLVSSLSKLDKKNQYTILLRKKYYLELRLPKNWKKVLTDYRHYSFTEQLMLPKVIASENPDIVHFPHFNAPLLCSKPYVVTIHDLLMHKQKGMEATTLPLIQYGVKRIGYRMVFDNAVKMSSHIIVPSNTVKEEMVKFYKIDKDKISVTYEGVNPPDLVKVDKEKLLAKYSIPGPYFIYTGNAYPHKNLKRLIAAIKALNTGKSQKIYLAIVSSRNVFVKRLEEEIKEEGAQSLVKILGFVPDNDLFSLYANSLAFTYPSLSEGFGLPGLEAILSGTLCLASNIAIFKEIYKDNAIYFNPFDYSSIEGAMRDTILMGEGERERIIKKGQQFIKKYSWDTMAEETLKIYEGSAGLRQGQ